MPHKIFAKRLNEELDTIGMPENLAARTAAFAKIFKISRGKAGLLLNGTTLPDETLSKQIATELEVDEAWLLAKR